MKFDEMPDFDLPIEEIASDLEKEEEEKKDREYWDKQISLEGTGLGTRHDEEEFKRDPTGKKVAA